MKYKRESLAFDNIKIAFKLNISVSRFALQYLRHLKVTGFIIKRNNFGEADRLITLFTKEFGKIRTLAKGVRKVSSKRSAHLEIFNKARVSLYKGKNFYYISEIEQAESYLNLRKSLPKISISYQMCELVNKIVPEGESHEEIYFLLSEGFNYLNNVNGSVKNVHLSKLKNNFTSKLLRDTGFMSSDSSANPEEYAQIVLERPLTTSKFISETFSM